MLTEGLSLVRVGVRSSEGLALLQGVGLIVFVWCLQRLEFAYGTWDIILGEFATTLRFGRLHCESFHQACDLVVRFYRQLVAPAAARVAIARGGSSVQSPLRPLGHPAVAGGLGLDAGGRPLRLPSWQWPGVRRGQPGGDRVLFDRAALVAGLGAATPGFRPPVMGD